MLVNKQENGKEVKRDRWWRRTRTDKQQRAGTEQIHTRLPNVTPCTSVARVQPCSILITHLNKAVKRTPRFRLALRLRPDTTAPICVKVILLLFGPSAARLIMGATSGHSHDTA